MNGLCDRCQDRQPSTTDLTILWGTGNTHHANLCQACDEELFVWLYTDSPRWRALEEARRRSGTVLESQPCASGS